LREIDTIAKAWFPGINSSRDEFMDATTGVSFRIKFIYVANARVDDVGHRMIGMTFFCGLKTHPPILEKFSVSVANGEIRNAGLG
jgi:hypothetical protein